MPSLSKDVTATVDRVQTIETLQIDGTHVRSATAVSITENISPVAAYAEIGIMAGGKLYANRVAVLAQGYIGAGASINWTGNIKGEGEQFLYISIWSNAANTYRVTLLSEAK